MLKSDGHIFLAGDGLSPNGPEPFLDAFDLRTRKRERLFTANPGVFEVVLAMLPPLDPDAPTLITSRETESEPPNLFVVHGATRMAVRSLASSYPDLDRAERSAVRYRRADGVQLSGSLHTPAGWKGALPLPTLVWIYPYEFDDLEQAEQIDVRAFQFHRVNGPPPLAAVLEGYAVLLNPTVPIVHDGGGMDDEYIPQLVASAEAAVEHLVSIGVTAPDRVAVAGRSYGAFSSANLLVHGRSAENPGTPTLQACRFFHALVGEGVPARYVELPFEGHHYWARESVLDASAEMIDWLDRTIGRDALGAGVAAGDAGAKDTAVQNGERHDR